MWFIRVLIPLYFLFYLATVCLQRFSQTFVCNFLLFVCSLWAISRAIVDDTIRDHSVPLFALGVFASLYKDSLYKTVIAIISTAFIISSACFLTSNPLTGFIHSIFDYSVVAIIIVLISNLKITWKLSPWLSAIIFDLYLVHFKCIILIQGHISLDWFLIIIIPLSFVVAYGYMKLRTLIRDSTSKLFSKLISK